jgi:hypothetical protein
MASTHDRWITGVGSRDTPEAIQPLVATLVRALAARGYGFRSGGARGADTMFENAAGSAGAELQVFVTGRRARSPHHTPMLTMPTAIQEEAAAIAAAHHPVWPKLDEWEKALHTRNVPQVLGPTLRSPSKALVCWAPRSELDEQGRLKNVGGGTGQAARVAYAYGVPSYNLALPDHVGRLCRLLRVEWPSEFSSQLR